MRSYEVETDCRKAFSSVASSGSGGDPSMRARRESAVRASPSANETKDASTFGDSWGKDFSVPEWSELLVS